MGNICGKESKADPFAQPGRTLGSAPPQQSRASIPKGTTGTGASGRTLGGTSAASGNGSGAKGSDARGAAAKAAEVGDVDMDRLAPRFKNYPDPGRMLTML